MSTDELREAYAQVIERIDSIFSNHPHGRIKGRDKQRLKILQIQAWDLYSELTRRERWKVA